MLFLKFPSLLSSSRGRLMPCARNISCDDGAIGGAASRKEAIWTAGRKVIGGRNSSAKAAQSRFLTTP